MATITTPRIPTSRPVEAAPPPTGRLDDYELVTIPCPIDGGPRPAFRRVGRLATKLKPPGHIAAWCMDNADIAVHVTRRPSRRQQIRETLRRLGGPNGADGLVLSADELTFNPQGDSPLVYVTKKAGLSVGRWLADNERWPTEVGLPPFDRNHPQYEAVGAKHIRDVLIPQFLASDAAGPNDPLGIEPSTRRAPLPEAIGQGPKSPALWFEAGWPEAPDPRNRTDVILAFAGGDNVAIL